eukprot:Gregarina_sp_Poly_1__319@NODE_1078_length_5165_cov_88_419969_g749_i0_p3_GENE_NODE_1078_length_5165_cov_88_419969_g749_i0NODE_1078_length_5165_cov_88_419969_g749_i0_p3_ORF_typecomplete_len218_score18_80COPI_assoc/PF08507_10/8_5e14_NODE_1078_length_5165_cov_88_419969_g749_i021732826
MQGYRFLGDAYGEYDQAFKRPQVHDYPADRYANYDARHQDLPGGPPGTDQLAWKDMFTDLPKLHEIKQELEGPKPLRVLAALGGFSLFVSAALSLINIGTFFMMPSRYVVEGYMALFGLAIITIEAKSAGHSPTGNKAFLYRWFPFVSIVGGKGLSYIFFGTLGLSFGQQQVLLFGSSLYVGAIGLAYCLIHFANFKTLGEKYDKSVYYSQAYFNRG